MDFLPPLVLESLKKWFSYPEKEIHCQVTTTLKGQPHVRTMKLYEVTPDGLLVFLSRNDTQKWRDLVECPQIAVLFLNEEYGQMVVEGTVELKTNREVPLVQKYWDLMPPMIQKIYLPQDVPSNRVTGYIPDSFGVIFIRPISWDVLHICKEDYLTSKRKQFRIHRGSWLEQDLNPV